MSNPRELQDWFDRQREERRLELETLSQRTAAMSTAQSSAAVRQMFERRFKRSSEEVTATPREIAEQDRPEAVVVEVRGLFETRPVTNMLRSPNFRRQLERIVRASVVAARETRSNSDISSASSQQSREQQQQSREQQQEQEEEGEMRDVQLNDQLREYQEQHRQRLLRQQQPQPQRELEQHQPPQAEQLPQPPQVNVESEVMPQLPFLQRGASTFTESLLQEQIISDISELLHTRLVSSTLNSNFRNRLENLVGRRVDDVGGGEQVLQSLQQLPPSAHLRNDFSNLGIPTEGPEADAISIVSATAAAVPMSHTSLGISRELAANREEMRSMRQLVRMVFDMQADLKRCIQQEVAAALATTAPATAARPTPPPPSTPFTSGTCLICMTAGADTIAYRCGHLCMCYACSVFIQQHQSASQTCPVCRAPVQEFVRIYQCSDNL